MKTLKGIAITLILFSLMFTMATAAIDNYYATQAFSENINKLPQANVEKWKAEDADYGSMNSADATYGRTENYDASGSDVISKVRVCWKGYYSGAAPAPDDEIKLIWYFDGDAEHTVYTIINSEGTAGSPFVKCYDISAEKVLWNWADIQNLNMKIEGVKVGGSEDMIYYGDSNYIEVTHTPPLGNLAIALNQPNSNVELDQGNTFVINGTTTCEGVVGATCGTVQLTARYGNPNPTNVISGASALQTTNNPMLCGAMTRGDSCSGQWVVTAAQQGTYHVDVLASSTDVSSNDTINRQVTVNAPPVPPEQLVVTIQNPTASASFLVGGNITVQAQVLSNSTPVSTATVTMSGVCTGAMSYTGSNGVYDAQCELATTGNKTVTVTAQNDTRQDQESVNFGVHDTQELRLQISQPVQNTLFERGECADLIVQVFIGSTVTTNAFVKGNTSTGLVFDLMAGMGNYTATYCFGATDPSPFKFEFTATEEIDGEEQSVSDDVTVKLKSVHLEISLLTQGLFYVGNLVKPKVEMEYEDGTAVTGASVSGEVQGKEIEFQEIGSGVYESITSYYVSVSDEIAGQLTISLEAIDAQQNTGELGESLQIAESNIAYKIEELGPGSTLFCFNQPKTFTFEVTDLADNTKDDVNVMGFYHNDFYPGVFVGNGTYEVEFQMPPTAQSEIDFVAFKNGERSEELAFEFNLTDQLSLAYPGEFQENGTLWSENQSIEIMVIYPDGTPVESGTFTVEIGEENNTRTFEMIYTNGTWVANLNLTNITYGTQTLQFAGQDELGNNLDIEVEFTFSAGGPIDIFLMLIIILIVTCLAIFIGLFSRLYGTAQKRLSKNLTELNKEEENIEQEERNARYSFYKRVIDSVTLKEKILGYNKEKAAIEAKKAALKKKYQPKGKKQV